jgi:hypothetical protein
VTVINIFETFTVTCFFLPIKRKAWLHPQVKSSFEYINFELSYFIQSSRPPALLRGPSFRKLFNQFTRIYSYYSELDSLAKFLSMVDLEDPADVIALMKKLWCHGQAIAPLQGLAYGAWALNDPSLSRSLRILLWVAALKFPIWGYVSWKSLHLKFRERSFRVLAVSGAVVIAMDLLIAGAAFEGGELSTSWPLVAFIFTCLHAVETTAFLMAVTCFRWALFSHAASNQELSADNSAHRIVVDDLCHSRLLVE